MKIEFKTSETHFATAKLSLKQGRIAQVSLSLTETESYFAYALVLMMLNFLSKYL
jgi:hypothetical protein